MQKLEKSIKKILQIEKKEYNVFVSQTDYNKIFTNNNYMIKTTSYKLYKKYKAEWLMVELVSKQDLNPYKK